MVATINCNLPLPFICTNLRLDAKANNVSAGPFFNTLLHKTSELPLQIWVHLILIRLHIFFYKQHFFFSTQPRCCLTFSWIELQMLLRCYLIHINIIILRHILYFVYFCPCLGLFMLYLCDLLFLFNLNFIVINHITSHKQTHLFFVHSLE